MQDEAMLGINAAVTMNVDNGVTLSASPAKNPSEVDQTEK